MKKTISHFLFFLAGPFAGVALAQGSDLEKDYRTKLAALIPAISDEDESKRYGPRLEVHALTSQASGPGQKGKREAWCGVLLNALNDTKTPQPARAWILRQLENIGGAESVEALGLLLADSDVQLRELARRALEKNSSNKAGKALRDHLKKGGISARWRIGLISALGERRDKGSVGALGDVLKVSTTLRAASKYSSHSISLSCLCIVYHIALKTFLIFLKPSSLTFVRLFNV